MKRVIAGILLSSVSLSASAALDIQHWQTTNGARVLFVETHQIPMVKFEVGFDAAGARDPEDKHGLASLVNTLMDDGAAGMGEEAIADRLASVGAEYSGQSARDMSVLQLQVLSEKDMMDPAVNVFSKIIVRPDFPSTALERERQRALVGLEQSKQSPQAVATRMFYARLFAGHPYGHMPEGDEDSVKRITRADLVAFHEHWYTGANAVVAIVGDLRRGEAEDLAERIVGSLPEGRAAPPLPPVPDHPKAMVVHESFPSEQTHLLLGQPGLSRDDPDYFPLYVGNHILGGNGLISRLAQNIREDQGLAYSVYSYFIPMHQRGPYIVGLQTRNAQASRAQKLALDTLRDFIEQGPTDDELRAAKNNITGGFPLRIDSNDKIADNLLSMAFYDLPLDYLDTFSGKVAAVTAGQIRDAFQRRIDLRHWVQVRVGPVE
jgi:zinc protease